MTINYIIVGRCLGVGTLQCVLCRYHNIHLQLFIPLKFHFSIKLRIFSKLDIKSELFSLKCGQKIGYEPDERRICLSPP